MDEQDRTHCRLDLHKMEPSAWVQRWGAKLDDWLLADDHAREIKDLEAERDDAEADAEEAEEKVAEIDAAARQLISAIEEHFDDAIPETINNAIGGVESAL